ncbi:MAG: flagellar protein FlaG [Nitrospira sp.]|jgi:flagellar protein FlaG|nr:flagellar protein FlaG [Nitrospira sp.]OYT24019.1 MAG: flagellar biosynthesis protein FlaG [Nitrospira sp. UW-LDO-02]MBK9997906.1 flagellar protein FlaG [Nitrospira sp.]HNV33338.1 flagellar protein FlaG [Nitrospira sp.]HPW15436.1 flagellar protein FlaG [Nitrospira sp.]
MVHQVSNHKDLPAAATHASQSGPQHAVDKKAEAQRPEPETSTTEVKGEVKGKDLEQALSRVREVFQKADSRLEFSVDPDLDRVVVKVMDGDSGTVIRQIPQQEVIDLAKRLETPTGLLLHHKV